MSEESTGYNLLFLSYDNSELDESDVPGCHGT
jgi:hypothetical protein